MNIKTITLHCTDNCGSSLQTLALQKYLEDQGHDASIIDYAPSYLKYNGSFLKSVIKSVVMFKDVHSQKRKNRNFMRAYLRLTDTKYPDYKALQQAPPESDIYITGSDQLWNPSYLCGRDPAYYLDFVPMGRKKYAYAASVGKENVSQEEKDLIVGYVKSFQAISVRENCTKQWLAPLVSCPVEHVCDPVFLKDREYYRSIAKKPHHLGKYILVYLVQPSETLDRVIAYLRKALDAKVVLIYGARKNCDCDYHFRDVSPEEFLGYIDGAAHVVASSFHATAFSCILRKQFTVVLPQHNTVRIEDILQTAGLENRIIRPNDTIGEEMLETVNYSAAGEKLEQFIAHSKAVLNGYCEGN